MTPQPQQQHVRWFGRSEDDPNRLLIIEDEHSRVFLDYPLREELYAVINSSRPAPLPHTDTGDCLVICQHCGKVTQVQCKEQAP
jgi:hypothetical protein